MRSGFGIFMVMGCALLAGCELKLSESSSLTPFGADELAKRKPRLTESPSPSPSPSPKPSASPVASPSPSPKPSASPIASPSPSPKPSASPIASPSPSPSPKPSASPVAFDPILPNRRIDWSRAGVVGGIPSFSTVIDVSTRGVKGDNLTDNAAAVQTLINSAAAGTVLYFPAGTYRFSRYLEIQRSRIVLRGAGSGSTKLVFTYGDLSGYSAIHISGSAVANETAVTGGLSAGSNQLVVASLTGFAVGQLINLDQDNDASVMGTTSPAEWDQYKRAVGQTMRVTAIDATTRTLTVDPPLRLSYKSTLFPRVRAFQSVEQVGFENFAITFSQPGEKSTFNFKRAANSWIRGVYSTMTSKAHVLVGLSAHLTIRDSKFEGSYRYDGGGHGYGIQLYYHSTDCLVENNVFRRLRHAMMVSWGANGNVYGYNYSTEGLSDYGRPLGDISVHGHYSHMNLFEGNVLQMVESADWWGPSGPGTTFFRNRTTYQGIFVYDRSQSQNIVGNVTSAISVSSTAISTFSHGNLVSGAAKWDPAVGTTSLPASEYRTTVPPFWPSTLAWPSIGPGSSGANTNPAMQRELAGQN